MPFSNGSGYIPSPRHADLLLATGPVTKDVAEVLRLFHDVLMAPNWVVTKGGYASDVGCFAGSDAVIDGFSDVIPVALHVQVARRAPTNFRWHRACFLGCIGNGPDPGEAQ